jgi:hypothetical protein
VHIVDTFFVNLSGVGAGVDSISVGSGKLAVAAFRTDGDNSTKPGSRFNLDFSEFAVNPGGKLRVTGTFVRGDFTGGTSGGGAILACETGSDPAIGTSNYVASSGNNPPHENCGWDNPDAGTCKTDGTDPPDGPFLGRDTMLGLKLKDIPDGLSKTIFLGERCGGDSFTAFSSAPSGKGSFAGVWAGNGRPGSGTSVRGAGRCYGRMISLPINDFLSLNNGKAYNSFHRGGANFLLGDASVMFISENCDYAILQKMAKRDDGLVGNNATYGPATSTPTPIIDPATPSMPQ